MKKFISKLLSGPDGNPSTPRFGFFIGGLTGCLIAVAFTTMAGFQVLQNRAIDSQIPMVITWMIGSLLGAGAGVLGARAFGNSPTPGSSSMSTTTETKIVEATVPKEDAHE